MAVPQPDDLGILAKIGGAISVGAAAVFSFLFHRVIQKHDADISEIKRIAGDAVSGDEFVGYTGRNDAQMDALRKQLEKVFDWFREHDKDDRTRYDTMMSTMHGHHHTVLEELLKLSKERKR